MARCLVLSSRTHNIYFQNGPPFNFRSGVPYTCARSRPLAVLSAAAAAVTASRSSITQQSRVVYYTYRYISLQRPIGLTAELGCFVPLHFPWRIIEAICEVCRDRSKASRCMLQHVYHIGAARSLLGSCNYRRDLSWYFPVIVLNVLEKSMENNPHSL